MVWPNEYGAAVKLLESYALAVCALAATPPVVRLELAGEHVLPPALWGLTRTEAGARGPDEQILRVTTRLVAVSAVVHDKKCASAAGSPSAG